MRMAPCRPEFGVGVTTGASNKYYLRVSFSRIRPYLSSILLIQFRQLSVSINFMEYFTRYEVINQWHEGVQSGTERLSKQRHEGRINTFINVQSAR